MPVSPLPEGYASVTPYLVMRDAAKAIQFYIKAFGATEVMRMSTPDGKVGHAEIEIGNSKLMLSEEYPEMGAYGPKALGGSCVSLLVYVENADRTYARAIKAGAEEVRPVEDQFYGDRAGTLRDPFGHVWTIATHVEDVDEDELAKRSEAFFNDG